jgi:hypothetical protein
MGKLYALAGLIGMVVSGGCAVTFLADDVEMIGVVAIFGGGPFLLSALLFAAGRRLHRIDSAGSQDVPPKG